MTTDPKLAPPGAGLPFKDRILLRYLVGPIISRLIPLEKSREQYELLTKKIIELSRLNQSEQRSIRILVPPIQGLEDSSRFWSIHGVLEHLLIVSRSMERVILELAAGKTPKGKADVAAVKPKHFEMDSLAEFEAYAPGLMARIDEACMAPGMNIQSSNVFVHPWFGAITARQWYWVLATHQGIHYKQIKEIRKALNPIQSTL